MVKNDCFPGGRKPRDVDANGILVKNIQASQGLLDATTVEDKVEPEQNVYANMGIILGGRSHAVLTNNQRPHSNGTPKEILPKPNNSVTIAKKPTAKTNGRHFYQQGCQRGHVGWATLAPLQASCGFTC
ncbi:hypothetical protein ACA910_007258 [Epithemia clementina (nom. ined.)]